MRIGLTLVPLCLAAIAFASPTATAQDIQDRTIRFGHLNNTDHPVSMVDGQENPYSVILSNKFYEVQKFVSGTNHVYAANIMLVSKKVWDTLTPTEQRIMQEAANEARDHERKVNREAASKAVGELTKNGMAFNEIGQAERDKMRATVKPITDKFSSEYDPNLVKLYNSELERVRKMN